LRTTCTFSLPGILSRRTLRGLTELLAAVSGWAAARTNTSRSGQLIGHKTQLTFVIIEGKDKKEKINTGWIMHEFRLQSPASSGPNKAKFDDLVLCRIHFKKNSNKCWEYAGSVADSGAVSFTQ